MHTSSRLEQSNSLCGSQALGPRCKERRRKRVEASDQILFVDKKQQGDVGECVCVGGGANSESKVANSFSNDVTSRVIQADMEGCLPLCRVENAVATGNSTSQLGCRLPHHLREVVVGWHGRIESCLILCEGVYSGRDREVSRGGYDILPIRL